ncbi:LysR family transcriptional regulator [Acetobacter pasteurianus]|uniref:Transcriptional regulator LysR n=2 Tax=Acetobacter pasteurianus TaxID=438 RepID=C7JHJ9_ACEP3|nr:LysR family transcriptional regulator [Acetobacter pasteurianus]ASC07049.1 HTH-type transcriptional regulator AbgR [Acetobacter pasteurianus subsp. pasteurianus]BAH99453.1 transcriptional regulator LysR [Acetobacter pasteurianus IFO 3283-01]BAI02506.1 transcriptional regulator LysR [Acetobacter pasteurianus IFO 3283-03]BAI05552.1 transcriptional regulator LysR [Acetobacter pasteurianus IFO 3283-07]BAI08601.1 transcriptional regulator LysR [Acetobacter pasteurianus IFO 3283-22]
MKSGMTLEQLRFFIAVAEREHVTAASKALHVTQSAVSAAIATLEEQHAVKLFHRVGRGICLTEAGRLFLPEARAVLAQAEAAENMLEAFSGLKQGTLRVVASQTIAAYWLPALLVKFCQKYPQIVMDIAISNTEEAAHRVKNGEVDLGIVEGQVDDPTLAQWPVATDSLSIVQADAHVPATIDATWLRSAKWVMREPGSGTRTTLEHTLRQHGIDPAELDVTLVLPSNESVRTAIEAGAGIGALSALVIAPAVQAGTLHAVPQPLGTRFFYGLRHKERYRSPAAEALLELIAQSSKVQT